MPQLSVTTTSITGQAKRKRDPEGTPELIPIHLTHSPRKRPHLTLTVTIPSSSDVTVPAESKDDYNLTTSPMSGLSEPDSLFDEPTTLSSPRLLMHSSSCLQLTPALLTAPLIRGLFFTPTLQLPEAIADSVTRYCLDTFFQKQGVNQVMLFGRFRAPQSPSLESVASPFSSSTGLPPVLLDLLSELETMLLPTLPPETHALLFPRVPAQARQAILNLYQPGEGISPHVDLLRRFGDGIIGVSLGSGCVMQFVKVGANGGAHSPGNEPNERKSVYLPERSVIVLSEDARYGWTHGIGSHTQDYVASHDTGVGDTTGKWIARGVRLSITFRWLLPGADVVGDPAFP
ncbi:hypothetical protein D9615_000807 [Tricholomella constricta]|uniref:Fe2OG dioxygenase domain-containing protein n=1 Tax=Tricholomella constricta TaxID=117010 RepID=A0A8H5HRT0_9AGAR|nr:hypothetical protein D9615_000807 [Tricholomella constricta]